MDNSVHVQVQVVYFCFVPNSCVVAIRKKKASKERGGDVILGLGFQADRACFFCFFFGYQFCFFRYANVRPKTKHGLWVKKGVKLPNSGMAFSVINCEHRGYLSLFQVLHEEGKQADGGCTEEKMDHQRLFMYEWSLLVSLFFGQRFPCSCIKLVT